MESEIWTLLQHTKRQHKRGQGRMLGMQERPTTTAERRAVLKEATAAHWQEGVIEAYMADPAVQGRMWEVEGIRLMFWATAADHAAYGARVATEAFSILRWIGVPLGFTAVLWWRDDPRELTADAWPTRREVNGGWTTPGDGIVYIYRSEEWERVMIHEVIHALRWDWKMPQKPLACWGLPDGSEIVPALFEAWTELLAEWMWVAWGFEDLEAAWGNQRAWQEMQAVQILARHDDAHPWKENTSVFAYYVLKAALASWVAELWVFGNGGDAAEREKILCSLAGPELDRLRGLADRTRPVAMSLKMTAP
jgi:hypothetical protein